MKMSNNVDIENFGKICRTCLVEGDMEPLFQTCSTPKDVCLIEKLMSCTFIQIKEDDGLPVNICLNCIKEINQAYTFAKKCQISDKTLRKCLSKSSYNQAFVELNKNNDNLPDEEISSKKPKIKITPSRRDLNRHYVETKENQPVEETADKTNEDKKIKVKDEVPLEEFSNINEQNVEQQQLDYIKIETTTTKEECEDYSDSNEDDDDDDDINDDTDYSPDKSENEESDKPKRTYRRRERKHEKHSNNHNNDHNSDDDFSWNLDSPSEKKEMKTKKKRRGTPRRQGPPFICKRCDITFETHEEIVEHRTKVRHYPPKNKPCPVCEKLFTTWKLKSHMRTHTKERPYLCSFCGKGFTLDTNLRRHLMIHTGERPHKCHLCEKAFIQMTQLQDHLRVHSGETPFVCSVCGKSFKQPSVLRLHMKHKHSEEGDSGEKRKREGGTPKSNIDPNAIPEHECPTCNKRYHTKAVLNQHMLTHGEKRFLCSDCGKGFISKASLQVHSKVCEKSFSQMGSLQMHNLIHTGEKPNVCLVCKKSFTQPSHLKYHMRTHTGEKPYSCTVCGKNFSTSGTLTVHKRTHTGETPYLCPICGKGFYDSSSMKKHKRRHGEQNTQC